MMGWVHSLQSLGAVDGPGIRFVAFLQGCPLRCGCCHNPDTLQCEGGEEYSPKALVDKAERYREYFGKDGGITLSGGEPLLQAKFVRDVFELCHDREINTCLDTSGCILNDDVKALLIHTDRVLLDIKYTDTASYQKYVGCSLENVLEFLDFLNQQHLPVTLRQVIIPTLNDNEENICRLNKIAKKYPCVDQVELLPFRKICQVKYDNMGLKFPFGHLPQPTKEQMKQLENLVQI